jgi:hypothetical protein
LVDVPRGGIGEAVGQRADLGVVGIGRVPADNLGHVPDRQGRQAPPLGRPRQDQLVQRRPLHRRERIGIVGSDHQHRRSHVHQTLDGFQRQRLGRMQVVEHQQRRP